jgi:hypothetical protein
MHLGVGEVLSFVMMRGWWLLVVMGVLPACLLELDAEVACGDGYVDRRPGADEECDPGDDDSLVAGCLERGVQTCDPVTCQIHYEPCPNVCGNGIVEPLQGEECDPTLDDLAASGNGRPCTSIDNPGPLEFADGTARCVNCVYDLRDCHYCGDGRRQREGVHPEDCDGLDFDPDARAEFCFTNCGAADFDPVPTAVSCQAECASDCGGFAFPADGKRCCLPGGETRVPGIPCCNPPAPGDPSVCGPGIQG